MILNVLSNLSHYMFLNSGCSIISAVGGLLENITAQVLVALHSNSYTTELHLIHLLMTADKDTVVKVCKKRIISCTIS